jgi:hypothetical protein
MRFSIRSIVPAAIPAAIMATAIFLFIRFITGYQMYVSDQTLYLTTPFRSIFPNYCPRDWFVWQTTPYHYGFSFIIQGLSLITGSSIEIGVFGLWLACMGLFLYGVLHLVRSMGGSFSAFTAVIMLLLLYSSTSLGNSSCFLNFLVPSFMGSVTILYAVSFLIRDRLKTAYFLLALATLLHIHFGVVGLPLFLAYALVSQPQTGKMRRHLIAAGLFILVSLPVILPTWLNFRHTDSGLDILFTLRAPHHFNPLSFGAAEWITTLLPWSCALFFIWRQRAWRSALGGIIAVISGLFIITGIISAVPGTPLIFKKVFVWRFAPYLLILCYTFITNVFFTSPRRKETGAILALWGGLALFTIKHDTWYEAAAVVLCGLLLVVVRWITEQGWSRIPVLLSMGCLLIIGMYTAGGVRQHRYKVRPCRVQVFSQDPFFTWLRTHTSPDALLLVPPEIEGIQVAAHRSIVVNYKNVPGVIGAEILEWKQRLERITGGTPLEQLGVRGYALGQELDRRYCGLDPRQVQDIMAYYKADYFVTRPSHTGLAGFITAGFSLCYADRQVQVYRPPWVP